MNVLVISDTQTVVWVDVTAEEIRKGRATSSSNWRDYLNCTAALLFASEHGIGIPCQCGCDTVIEIGGKVLKVSSPFVSVGAAKTFYYYASVACERRAMVEVAAKLSRKRRKYAGSNLVSLMERSA